MAFEGLDISIGGDSAGAKGAIASVKSSLAGLERSANSAQDSVEELGDEASGTSTRISFLGATAGASLLSLLGLSSAAKGAAGSLAALGVSTGTVTTALVGLAAVAAPLVATLGALAAGAASLAAVFGGGIAAGVVTHMEALKSAFAEARAEILELIEPVGELFGPILVDAVEALPTLVENILEAVGPLEEFRDALVEFGDEAMDVIPGVAAAMGDLARRALPILEDFIDAVGTAAPGAFNSMLDVAEAVSDELLSLATAAAGVIPQLTAFGVVIIQGLAPAAEALIGVLDGVLARLTDIAGSDGAATLFSEIQQQFTALIPAVRDLVQEFAPVVAQLGEEAPAAVAAFGTAAKDLVELATRVADVVAPVLERVVGLAGGLFDVFNNLSPAAQKVTVAALALGPALSGLTTAVGAVVGAATTLVGILGSVVSVGGSVASVLGTVAAVLGGPVTLALAAGVAAITAYKTNLFGFRDAVHTVLSAVRSAFDDAIDGIGNAFNRLSFDPFVDGLNAVSNAVQDLINGLNTLAGVDIDVDVPTFSELMDEAKSIVSPSGGGGGGDGGGGGGGGGGSVGGRDPDDPADAPSATPPGQVGDDDNSYDPGDGTSGGIGNPGYGTGLATGGLVGADGVAMLHEGERVLPESQVTDRGEADVAGSGVTIENLTVNASGRREGREAGQALKRELKRFDV